MKRFSFWVLALLLTACGVPVTATLPPTPQAVVVSYPLSLIPWSALLAECVDSNPQIALYLFEAAPPAPGISSQPITLLLGDSSILGAGDTLHQLGWEQIIIIANYQGTFSALTSEELSDLYTSNPAVSQVWVYDSNSDLQRIFAAQVLDGRQPTSQAMLAPSPLAMLEAVASSQNAIGFLPQSWLSHAHSQLVSSVRLVQLEAELSDRLRQPVLAMTDGEPAGASLTVLQCVTEIGE